MLGLAGKIALSSPPFAFKAFQPRMISSVAEAFPCPVSLAVAAHDDPSCIRSNQPYLSRDFQKSVKTTLPLALVKVECYKHAFPMVVVIVHLCASMLQPRPSCQAVLCRRLAGSGIICVSGAR
jgi:hypothetical protein